MMLPTTEELKTAYRLDSKVKLAKKNRNKIVVPGIGF
jgi:hypothetical protein